MSRLNIATRGICSWRERLAHPDKQWKRKYSAFEAAVSWETAATADSGLPAPIQKLLAEAFGLPQLLMAIGEHKVALPGGNADSQNDVWALVKTNAGTVSLSVEAKAREPFGTKNLDVWLKACKSAKSLINRQERWDYLRNQLPVAADGAYAKVAYQLLHRSASAVIEARRFGLKHAACIVQAFKTPEKCFNEFQGFCGAMGLIVSRGAIVKTKVDDIQLAIGWADCPLATDQEIAKVAS